MADCPATVEELCKQIDSSRHQTKLAEIWQRLDVTKAQLPEGLVLAVLYMLHLETSTNEMPPKHKDNTRNISTRRIQILRRFGVWIACACSRDCDRYWNFANYIGMFRGQGICKTEMGQPEEESLLRDRSNATMKRLKAHPSSDAHQAFLRTKKKWLDAPVAIKTSLE